MGLVFNLIYFFLIIITSPWLIYRLLLRGDFYRVFYRFGYNLKPINSSSIWLHGASAGEIISLKKLVDLIKKNDSSEEIIISVCSSSGLELAYKNYPDCHIIFFPFDLSFIVNFFIKNLKPRLVILAESDFWPNFLYSLSRKKIPVFVVNGKISEQSLSKIIKTYLLLPLLRNISYFCVQKNSYKNRLINLGVDKERISITGDMKYDLIDDLINKSIDIRDQLNYSKNNLVIIAGSIHLEEVDLFLDSLSELAMSQENVRAVIAPRYPKDSKSIESKIKGYNFTSIRRTKMGGVSKALGDKKILILDTLGELRDFYGISDIAFVGGALHYRSRDKGGHNLMEPAILGIPVIFGPHNHSFEEVGNNLIDAGGGYKVYDVKSLKKAFTRLVNDDKLRLDSGKRAKEVVLEGQGASQANFRILKGMNLL